MVGEWAVLGFFGLFQGVDEEQRCAVCSMIGVEPMLGGVKEVVGFPCVADSVGQYACPVEETDWSEVFNAG